MGVNEYENLSGSVGRNAKQLHIIPIGIIM